MKTIDWEKTKDTALIIADKLIFLENALCHEKNESWIVPVVASFLGDITEVYQNEVISAVLKQAKAQEHSS